MHPGLWTSFVLFCAVLLSEADGKGAYRVRAPMTTPASSGLWQHGGTGLVGGGPHKREYTVGTKTYHHHIHYEEEYYEYYKEQPADWRAENPLNMSKNCSRVGAYPDTSSTDSWLVGEVVMRPNATVTVTPVELEVDLFMELLYRSSCHHPSEVVILYKCVLPSTRPLGKLTDDEKSDAKFCAFIGDVSSHAASRSRTLLQTSSNDSNIHVEYAVGAEEDSVPFLTAAINASLTDESGSFSLYYGVVRHEGVEVNKAGVDPDRNGLDMSPSVESFISLFVILGVSVVGSFVLYFRGSRRSTTEESEEISWTDEEDLAHIGARKGTEEGERKKLPSETVHEGAHTTIHWEDKGGDRMEQEGDICITRRPSMT